MLIGPTTSLFICELQALSNVLVKVNIRIPANFMTVFPSSD